MISRFEKPKTQVYYLLISKNLKPENNIIYLQSLKRFSAASVIEIEENRNGQACFSFLLFFF